MTNEHNTAILSLRMGEMLVLVAEQGQSVADLQSFRATCRAGAQMYESAVKRLLAPSKIVRRFFHDAERTLDFLDETNSIMTGSIVRRYAETFRPVGTTLSIIVPDSSVKELIAHAVDQGYEQKADVGHGPAGRSTRHHDGTACPLQNYVVLQKPGETPRLIQLLVTNTNAVALLALMPQTASMFGMCSSGIFALYGRATLMLKTSVNTNDAFCTEEDELSILKADGIECAESHHNSLDNIFSGPRWFGDAQTMFLGVKRSDTRPELPRHLRGNGWNMKTVGGRCRTQNNSYDAELRELHWYSISEPHVCPPASYELILHVLETLDVLSADAGDCSLAESTGGTYNTWDALYIALVEAIEAGNAFICQFQGNQHRFRFS